MSRAGAAIRGARHARPSPRTPLAARVLAARVLAARAAAGTHLRTPRVGSG